MTCVNMIYASKSLVKSHNCNNNFRIKFHKKVPHIPTNAGTIILFAQVLLYKYNPCDVTYLKSSERGHFNLPQKEI